MVTVCVPTLHLGNSGILTLHQQAISEDDTVIGNQSSGCPGHTLPIVLHKTPTHCYHLTFSHHPSLPKPWQCCLVVWSKYFHAEIDPIYFGSTAIFNLPLAPIHHASPRGSVALDWERLLLVILLEQTSKAGTQTENNSWPLPCILQVRVSLLDWTVSSVSLHSVSCLCLQYQWG